MNHRGPIYDDRPLEAYITRDPNAESTRQGYVQRTVGETVYAVFLMLLLLLILAGVLVLGIWALTLLGHINAEVDDVACDDGNPCRMNFYRFEGCHYLPSKNYLECNDSCLVNGVGMCHVGQCTGECIGNCLSANQCPDVLHEDNSPLDKLCIKGGCVYRNFDPPPPILLSAGSADGLGVGLCRACLHPNEPLRDCLDVEAFFPVINPDNQLDEILCLYHFRCVEYRMTLN